MKILSEKYRFAQGVLNKISGGKKGLESMLNKSEASELPACIIDPAQAQLEQATSQTCIMILQLPLPLAIAVFRFLCFCDSGFPLPICCNIGFPLPICSNSGFPLSSSNVEDNDDEYDDDDDDDDFHGDHDDYDDAGDDDVIDGDIGYIVCE